jgi:hypothetical protein
MARARALPFAFVAATVLLTPTFAWATGDVQACLNASEKGQRARTAGKMREAHEHFLICGGEGCPTIVRKDCSQWNSELAATIPTVVFGARDKAGRDLFDVTVSMDGEVLVKKLDGKAVSVDPGPHTFRFEHQGFTPVTEKVLVKEGERARVFNVTFETTGTSPTPAPTASSDTPPKPPPNQPPTESGSGHTIFPWILVGAGVVAASIGIVLFVTTPDRPANCSEATKKCTRLPGEQDEDFRADQELGGLVWFFLESNGKKSASGARVAPWMTGQAGGLSVGGTF